MKTIWKYRFRVEDFTAEIDGTPVYRFEMPLTPRPISVLVDEDGIPALYCEVYDDGEHQTHAFAIVGTGRLLPVWTRNYVASWQDGEFVWHLYTVDVEHMLAKEAHHG